MSIYEEAGDVFFKGHRNRLAALPFFRVCFTWISQQLKNHFKNLFFTSLIMEFNYGNVYRVTKHGLIQLES